MMDGWMLETSNAPVLAAGQWRAQGLSNLSLSVQALQGAGTHQPRAL